MREMLVGVVVGANDTAGVELREHPFVTGSDVVIMGFPSGLTKYTAKVQFSDDNVNWDDDLNVSISFAGTGTLQNLNLKKRFIRISVTAWEAGSQFASWKLLGGPC